MGLRHARALASLPQRFEWVGAYDLRSEVPIPDGVARLHADEEAIAIADVVIVATPTAAHAGGVARALEAGRHVLVEKPLCPTGAESSAVARLPRRGGGLLFVGHSERFNPVVRALARLLRGDPLLAIDLLRVGPSRQADGGVLVNLGVHDFDLAAYLGGGPITLRGAVGRSVSADSGEDLAHVLFTTANGAPGHLCVDRTVPTKMRRIAIVTARWLYEGDLLAHRLVRTSRETGARTDVPLALGEPLASQALALADAIDAAERVGRAREIASGDDGAYAVGLAERAAKMVFCDPFESPAREKLVAAKAPLLPRE